jgi:hypothetical protein
MEEMKYIVVLDHVEGETHIYSISGYKEDVEEWLEKLGYSINDISWSYCNKIIMK